MSKEVNTKFPRLSGDELRGENQRFAPERVVKAE